MPDQRRWITGPPDDLGRYAVDDVRPGATVFRATRTADGAAVALKQFGAVSEETTDTIRAAHAAVRACEHPSLAKPIEVFRGPGLYQGSPPPEDERDLVYAVTEWVDGRTLWAMQAMDLHSRTGEITRSIADALCELHHAGFVHGDIHPGNIVMADDGTPVLIDIDSIREMGTDHPPDSTGVLGFIPPEADHRRTDAASDGWQLAMVAVQLLLGHPLGRDHHRSALSEVLRKRLGRRRARAVAARIEQMLATDPSSRPSDLRRWSQELDDALSAGSRRPVRSVALISCGVAAIIGGVAVATNIGDEPEPSQVIATSTVPMSGPVSAVDPICPRDSLSDGLPAPQRAVLASMADAVAADLDGQCVADASTFVNALVLQLDSPGGDVVVVSDGFSVRLTSRQWDAYREIGGRQRPENAADIGGYPVSRARDEHDRVFIEMSGGGVMIAVSPEDPPYWIPAQLRPTWEAVGGVDGEWGPPASHPFLYESGLVQDFEFVEIHTGADAMFREAEDIDFEIIRPEDPTEPLAEVEPIKGRILRQRSGVAWYVDDDGIRHWIPDGDTYFCVGGDDVLIEQDLPATAIWTLPAGNNATC